MEFTEAVRQCHVRSAIYRESNPKKLYWKNHTESLVERVPLEDQRANDWQEYDPADDYQPYYRMA